MLNTKTIVVNRLIPSQDLNDYELVGRIKAMYPKDRRQSLYGRFVQERCLKPGINAKDFNNIYDSVGANMHIESTEVPFKPTHINKREGRKERVSIQIYRIKSEGLK